MCAKGSPAITALLRAQSDPKATELADSLKIDLKELGQRNKMLMYFVLALVRSGKDTDENLALWFGSKENIKDVHRDARMMVIGQVPDGSPSGMMMQHFVNSGLGHIPCKPRPATEEEKKFLKIVEDMKNTMT